MYSNFQEVNELMCKQAFLTYKLQHNLYGLYSALCG
jgi:hypothetical protein